MKILGIYGSVRTPGNTRWMMDKLLDSAKTEGSNIEKVFLKELKIKYCVGCDACKSNDGNCIIKDDGMQEVYPKLLWADVIILGSPNYFKNVSGPVKNFIDRTNAFVRPRPRKLKGKYAIGLSVGGEELEDIQHCEDALVRFFNGHKMKILKMIKVKADEPNDARNIVGLEQHIVELGKGIVQNETLTMFDFQLNKSKVYAENIPK